VWCESDVDSKCFERFGGVYIFKVLYAHAITYTTISLSKLYKK
jgi:hypothetical protein